jgi:hypothetical protein
VVEDPIVGEAGPGGEWIGAPDLALNASEPALPGAPAGAGSPGNGRPAAAGTSGTGARSSGGAGDDRSRAGARSGAGARGGPRSGNGAAGVEDGTAQDSVPAAFAPRGLAQPRRQGRLEYTAPSEDATGAAVRTAGSASGDAFAKVGRNEPCPCGSGKKFKLCHGDPRNR